MENFSYPRVDALSVPRPGSARRQLHLREQIELGNFSLVGDREYVHDSSKLSYLIEPEKKWGMDWDLNLAMEKRIHKDHSLDEKLDNLLYWIRDNLQKFRARCDEAGMTELHTDFISYRGLLTTIMCSVYEQKENWILGATKYKNTIYLCQYETAERKEREKNMNDFMMRASAWGYKFEHFMTASSPDGKPSPEEGINEKEEFCTVVRTRLGKDHSLVYGAEVDAIDAKLVEKHPELKHSTKRYVEMKTSRQCTNSRHYDNLARFKLIKWYAQSFLIGIPRVICGFRDDNGVVDQLESYSLEEMVQQGWKYWNPEDMLSFLESFLQFVKKTVTNDDPKSVILFEYVAQKHCVNCMHLPANDPDFSKFSILPEWYISYLNQSLIPSV